MLRSESRVGWRVVVVSSALATFAGMLGCGRVDHPDPLDERREYVRQLSEQVGQQTLAESNMLEIVPDGAGGAYAFVYGGAVWYVRGKDGIQIQLNDLGVHDIVPDARGGAYARTVLGGLWYLRDGTAVRVGEVRELSGDSGSPPIDVEAACWARLQREIKRRASAEGRAQKAEDEVAAADYDRAHDWDDARP